MSASAWVERHGKAAAGAGVALMAVAVGVVLATGGAFNKAALPPDAPPAAFTYTADNGKTWFNTDRELTPPVDADGKPAVRAHLGRHSGGTVKVVWMERPGGGKGRGVPSCKTPEMSDWQSFPSEQAKLVWLSTLKGPNGKPPVYLN